MIRGREAIYLVLIDDTPNAFHDNDDHVTKNPAWAGALGIIMGTQFAQEGRKWPKSLVLLSTTKVIVGGFPTICYAS